MVEALTPVLGLTYLLPPPGTNGTEYLASVSSLCNLQPPSLTLLGPSDIRERRRTKS